MHNFLQHVSSYYTLSMDAIKALQACFTKVELYKNDLLLKEGQVCTHLYFIEKGSLRGFYNIDGKETTYWFGFENDFVTSFHSYITQTAAVENIQAMEHTVLWSVAKASLTQLFNEHHEIERLVRIAYERYYIKLEERFVNAQFKTAAQKYNELLQHNPHILNRVPLGYVAAYLGITQETLSRIRAKL